MVFAVLCPSQPCARSQPWAPGTFLPTRILCGCPLPFPVEWLIPVSVQLMVSAAFLQLRRAEFLLIILILLKYLLKALQHWDGNKMEGLGRPSIVSFTSS